MSDPVSFDDATPRLDLPLLFAGQSQKEFTVNEALLRADLAIQCCVEDESATPPPSPGPGQAWLVGPQPSGDFAGHAHAIAGFTASGWRFLSPQRGWRVFDRAAGCMRTFDQAWSRPARPALPAGGATTDAEARAALASLIEALVAAGVFATN